jgi:hypothetical protein
MQSNISVVCNEKPFSDENTTVFSGMTDKTKKQLVEGFINLKQNSPEVTSPQQLGSINS